MTKLDLQKTIAEHAYNVGFGAKKHFSSYDLIVKLPYWISFITLAIGVFQLGYPDIPYNKEISIALIIISIASLFLNFFNSTVNDYNLAGIKLTQIFNELKKLYYEVKGASSSDLTREEKRMEDLLNDFYKHSITKQVFMSQWYAHFKFFYEMQIDWIDHELKFKFFRDKVPNSLKTFIVAIFLILVGILSFQFAWT
jgi:hypothetical protein